MYNDTNKMDSHDNPKCAFAAFIYAELTALQLQKHRITCSNHNSMFSPISVLYVSKITELKKTDISTTLCTSCKSDTEHIV